VAPAARKVGVAVTDRQHIESYMRTRVRTMMRYDWWQAGIVAGTAPSEWETVEYGRDTSIAYLNDGLTMHDAIGRGFAAMYDLAYNDIRDSIRRRGRQRFASSATSAVDVYTAGLSVDDSLHFEWLDAISGCPGLSATQKKLAVLVALGWTVPEMADWLGLSRKVVRGSFADAIKKLRSEWV